MVNPKSPEPPAAIILAAGASVRMGQPKAYLRWGNRTFLEHLIARAASCHPIIVVAGAHPLDPGGLVRLVHNANWPDGPFSSLQSGAAMVAPGTGALVLTVDRPHVQPTTIDRLLHAHRSDPTGVIQPAYRGARGHPVLLPADLVRRLPAELPTSTLRDLLRQDDVSGRRVAIEVDDPAVLDNLDRAEDLVRLPES